MKTTKKWAEGKPPILEIFATQIASTAHELHLAFKDTKSRKFFNFQFPLPDLPAWFLLYKETGNTNIFIKHLFEKFSGFTQEQIDLSQGSYGALMNWDQVDKTILENLTPEDLEQARKPVQEFVKASYSDIENDIFQEPVDPEEERAFLEFVGNYELEAAFFLFVHVPSWILYQMSPQDLYDKAASGHIDSLEDLLRLDALMIHDPIIGCQVQSLRFRHKYRSYEDMFEAAAKRKPAKKITRKRIKYLMAGLISVLAEQMKCPLSNIEIQRLFDAIATDAGRGKQDDDFIIEPASFVRQVERNKPFWQKALGLDSKN